MVYVPVHNHTEYSPLDGMSTCREAAETAASQGAPALAITDHGTCSGHPQHQAECDRAGIRPIFGIEGYFRPDRLARPAPGDQEAQKKLRNGPHLVLLARSDQGLRDLWDASTESYATGHYGRPRMDWEVLEKYGPDLIATTACLGGVISGDLLAAMRGDTAAMDTALATLDRLKAVFPGRLYLEIQPNEIPDQRLLNQALAALARRYALPLVLGCDAHYPREQDAALHNLWMQCRTGKGDGYWHMSAMLSEERARGLLSYMDSAQVDQAIRSTLEIAEQCTARIGGRFDPPVFTPGGTAADDGRRLREMCLAGWHQVEREPDQQAYRDRFEREFALVADKGLPGCYLIIADIVSWVRGRQVLVGPGRGSDAGSLMSYLCGITSIDPLPAGLMFERFLTPGRESLPDFDVDFPSSQRDAIQGYVISRYGEDHVVRVGTELRYQSRGIVNKLFSVLAEHLPPEAPGDARWISRLIAEAESHTAGLGLPWDEVTGEPALAPYAEKYSSLFAIAGSLHGRIYSYGKHPAGLIISPQARLAGTMPMRRGEGDAGLMISQFDYRAAEARNLLKLDLLTISTLDTLQQACELVAARTGAMPDPRAWTREHDDPQVWDMIGSGNTLGVFQAETSLGQQYCRRHGPRTVGAMADLTTYVRPGPRRSGATESYLRRQAGLEEVTYPHPLLAEHLARAYGVILYQEDILAIVRILGGYSDLEADGVRKILGKKLTGKIETAGQEFTGRCVARGHDREQIEHLWSQMAEFGKYAFNRCVTGETRISIASSNSGTDGTMDVASLYRRLHAPLLPAIRGRTKTGGEYQGPCAACGAGESRGKWIRGLCSSCYSWRQKFHDPGRGLYGLSYWADGRIRPARIVDVVAQGVRETWKITLKDGRSLTATGNHRHLTNAGYRRVDQLVPGDSLIIDAGCEKDRYDPSRHRLTRGERRRSGVINGARGKANYGFVDGGAAFWKNWRETHEKVCSQCGTQEGRIELAHLDGDHSNNTDGNLSWMCASCHKAYDYARNHRARRWQKGHRAEAVPIESIEYAGTSETYDVVMDAPHNFVAGGIVTHNSHAYSYATLTYWTAWFKTHYPLEMFTAILSHRDMEDVPQFVTEARRIGITVLPPDVRFCKAGFSAEGLSIRYGLAAIKGVGAAALNSITRGQPYTSLEDFQARSGVNAGVRYALAQAGALDALVASRRGLVQVLSAHREGLDVRCVHKDPSACGPNGLPCTYGWESEPPPPPRTGKSGRVLKVQVKDPPRRCTTACRRYTPPGSVNMALVPDYTPAQRFLADWQTYGCWMSQEVFAQLGTMRSEARQVALMLASAPPGRYTAAAVYAGMHSARTRSGSVMWWATLVTEVSVLETAVFSPRDEREADPVAALRATRPGTMMAAELEKRSYTAQDGSPRTGWRLLSSWPLA